MVVPRYGVWSNIKTRSKAANLILQVKPTEKPLKEDFFLCSFMAHQHRGKVLDFGSGFGRNSFILASRCEELWAYDFPNMLKFLEEDFRYKNFNNIRLSSNWEEVKKQRFDAVVCCISIQHLHIDDLRSFLDDFLEITNNLYVNTRSHLDFGKELVYPVLTEKWKVERVYGKTTEEQVSKMTGNKQYFVHLVPK